MEEKMKEWLIKHYKHTENKKIMERFGLSSYYLNKYAKELYLKKSKQFMVKSAKTNSKKGIEVLKLKGYPPKGYIIPNQEKRIASLRARKGKKVKASIKEKRAEGIRNMLESEKRRVLFGLPQHTNRKVTRAPRAKVGVRWNMRKLGYSILRGGNEAYYDENTKRNEYFEKKAQKYGIRVFEMSE